MVSLRLDHHELKIDESALSLKEIAATHGSRSSIPLPGSERERAMARYYFHIRDGSRVIPDDEGMELGNVSAAWAEAHSSANGLARHPMRNGTCSIDITDQIGVVFGTVVRQQRLSA